MSEDMKEKIKKLKKEGWIDAWFAIEAMAIREKSSPVLWKSILEISPRLKMSSYTKKK